MPDPYVTSIMVVASTARTQNADSDMFIEVLIPGVAASEVDLPGTVGETRVVTMSASGSKRVSEITPADIFINTEPPNEGNAWLPAAFYVLGKDDSGDYQVICAISEWPSQIWISRDPSVHRYPDAFPGLNLDVVLSAQNPAAT